MIHFKLFYHLVSRSNFDPQTISFCRLGSWKKYILGIDQRKDNHPGSFHCKAFVLLYKFERLYSGLSVFPLVSYHPTFGFFQFFSNFSDKPVARSLQAYALTYLTDFFVWEGLSFMITTKSKEGARAIRATKYKTYLQGRFTRARAPLAQKYTYRIFESKDGTKSMKH